MSRRPGSWLFSPLGARQTGEHQGRTTSSDGGRPASFSAGVTRARQLFYQVGEEGEKQKARFRIAAERWEYKLARPSAVVE